MAMFLVRNISAIVIPMGLTLLTVATPTILTALIVKVLLLVYLTLAATVVQRNFAILLTTVAIALLLHWMENLILTPPAPERIERLATDSLSQIVWI